METEALNELLAARLGLDSDSMGPSFLNSVAHWAVQQPGYDDLLAFTRKASVGGELWQRLLEHVVVCETWFFRDKVPFEHVVETVRAKWQGPGAPAVRLLSCPCSTGEEAYSIALSLIDAGLPPEAFTVDAADVSASAIKKAEAGGFPPRSFRGGDAVERSRYFEHEAKTRRWRLKPAYRKMVRFHVANLMSPHELEGSLPYEVVLCRNLLIYLHADAREAILTAMRRLLRSDGVLIVGHAEPAIARAHGFSGIGDPRAFAFVKTPGAKIRLASRQRRQRLQQQGFALLTNHGSKHPAEPAMITGHSSDAAVMLDRIRQLGDQGQMDEALRVCRAHVAHVPNSAQGHYLLGVLNSAIGQEQAAETALRRAVYLDPKHAEALQHLALIHEAKGDHVGAKRLRVRAQRHEAREGQR